MAEIKNENILVLIIMGLIGLLASVFEGWSKERKQSGPGQRTNNYYYFTYDYRRQNKRRRKKRHRRYYFEDPNVERLALPPKGRFPYRQY